MSLQRICDRCAAPTGAPIDVASTTRTVIVPIGDPATARPSADVEIAIGMQARQDLCDACLGSALLAYAIARLGSVLSADAGAVFVARLQAAVTTAAKAAAAGGPA